MNDLCMESIYSAFNELKITEEKPQIQNCMRCGGDNIYHDTIDGNMVCIDCGNVLSTQMTSDLPEWNNFNSESNDRCEYNNNELLHSDNMCTQIAFKSRMKQSDWNTMKWQRTLQLSSKDRSLIKVYNKIEQCCTPHNINENIIHSTKGLYKFVSVLKLSRGAVREAMLASCLFYAFIKENSPRNIEEVSSIFQANPKKVNKTNKILSSHLWHSEKYKHLVVQNTSCEQIIYRYCNKIDILPSQMSDIITLSREYEKSSILIGKDCSYVAALSIYHYNHIHNLNISKDDICEACFLSTVTLNKLLKNFEITKN